MMDGLHPVTCFPGIALVQALARNSTRTERQTFVVSLGTELLAVLDARSARIVLHNAPPRTAPDQPVSFPPSMESPS